jgi:hypothetical protein
LPSPHPPHIIMTRLPVLLQFLVGGGGVDNNIPQRGIVIIII